MPSSFIRLYSGEVHLKGSRFVGNSSHLELLDIPPVCHLYWCAVMQFGIEWANELLQVFHPLYSLDVELDPRVGLSLLQPAPISIGFTTITFVFISVFNLECLHYHSFKV